MCDACTQTRAAAAAKCFEQGTALQASPSNPPLAWRYCNSMTVLARRASMARRQRCYAPAEACEASASGAVGPPASPRYGGFSALARSPGKSPGGHSAASPTASARGGAGADCSGEGLRPWGTPASARGSSSRLHSPLSSAGDAAAGEDTGGGAESARTPRRRLPGRGRGPRHAGLWQGSGSPDPAAASSFFGAPASSPPPRAPRGKQGTPGRPGSPAGWPGRLAAAEGRLAAVEGRQHLAQPWLCRPDTAEEGVWAAPPSLGAQRPPEGCSLGSPGAWGGFRGTTGSGSEPPAQAPALPPAALSALQHGVWGAMHVRALADGDSHQEGWRHSPGRAPGRRMRPQGRWRGQPVEEWGEAEALEGERAEGVWRRPPPPDAPGPSAAGGPEVGRGGAPLSAFRRPMRRRAPMS